MKASPTMQQIVQQLVAHFGVDLCPMGAFLRLDLPGHDRLVIDHCGPSQIAVAHCFEAEGEWRIDREVIFFTNPQGEWIPLEITQSATGWTAYARLSSDSQRIVRSNPCGQAQLATFTERWARKLLGQGWLEGSTGYTPWLPPTRKEGCA